MSHEFVTPELVSDIPALGRALRCVDGRDEPGHDGGEVEIRAGYALKIVNPRISSTRKITTKT
jgi:hypothetical protein